MQIFNRDKKKTMPVPAALKPTDPVNYNSVLDWLVGLSQADYDKMCKITNIYRDSNKKTAEVLGIEDKPTSTLFPEKPTDEEVDTALDNMLNNSDNMDLLEEDETPPPTKEQSASKKTMIDIKE